MTPTIAPHAASTARTRTARVLALLLLTVAGLLFAGAGPASAHAALTGSDPQQGSVVNIAPERVTLTFSEKVAVSADSVRVLDPKGNRVDTGEMPGVDGTALRAELHKGLPFGTFTVAYQVVSEDSHPVAGAFTFSVGAPSETSVALPQESAGGGAVGTLYDIARYVSYAGFTVLVGGAAFVLLCWRRGAEIRALQRLVVGGWLALTTGTLALLLLRGAYIGSGKLGDVLDMGRLAEVLQSRTGAALVCRLLLLAVAALFVAVLFGTYQRREDGAEKRDLSFGLALGGVVVATGLAATWALSEHASAGLQPGIAMPVDVVHLLAVALWLGGLAALLTALYRGPAAGIAVDRGAVRRFSRVAFLSVVALAVTGLYQSWRQVGSWDALTGTSYGRLLIVKAGLVALLVGIAWISRRWTQRLDEPGSDDAASGAGSGSGSGSGSGDGGTADGAGGSTVGASDGSGAASAGASAGAGAASAGAGAASAGAGASPAAGATGPATAGSGAAAGVGAAADGSGAATDGAADTTPSVETAAELGAASTMGSVGAAGAGAAVGSAGAAAAVAHLSGEVPAQKTGDADTSADAGDPRRAAQLARQRAAVEAARRRKERDADAPRSGLRRSVLTEAAVAVLVLAVTTALTGTEPARTEQQAKAASAAVPAPVGMPVNVKLPFDTGGEDGKGVVRLEFVPGRVGENTLHVYAEHSYGAPYDLPELKVALTLEAKDIGPLPVTPKHLSEGHWSTTGVQIPMAGDWKVSVTVRTSDIDQVTVHKNVKIG
ncbi:copper resistance protein CopC [Streptomyces sp. NPDC005012]|uniref:copper resistance CopC/CopD family protein n=1 Tax=Streptomyces sp. NPDC005012 TaxID=3154558 RepID=UPI00339DBACC